ncbi:MAG TPA: zf-TFIIB domain-containing protein [Rhodothermales bacterium]|nr:zf-TFIIB domain-containing protein [Rhodothermales bacterium]
MTCPNGHGPLQITDRSGVEIDYCPVCRGVWLDRGELDKLIDRALDADVPRARRDDDAHRYGHHERGYSEHGHAGHHRKRKESWLGDIFDF